MPTRSRVIVASRSAEERERIAAWLIAEHYEPVLVSDGLRAASEIASKPAVALIVEYGLTERTDLHGVWRARRPQTPPVVIGHTDATAQGRTEGLNAIYVQRPLERVTLLCMVLMSILEGRPERRSARRPSSLVAKLNGVASRIIDVSHEGVRLELPRTQRVPPPVFRLLVPEAGITLNVRRMWTGAPIHPDAGVMWCGGALTENSIRAAQRWCGFVETMPAAAAAASMSVIG